MLRRVPRAPVPPSTFVLPGASPEAVAAEARALLTVCYRDQQWTADAHAVLRAAHGGLAILPPVSAVDDGPIRALLGDA